MLTRIKKNALTTVSQKESELCRRTIYSYDLETEAYIFNCRSLPHAPGSAQPPTSGVKVPQDHSPGREVYPGPERRSSRQYAQRSRSKRFLDRGPLGVRQAGVVEGYPLGDSFLFGNVWGSRCERAKRSRG